MRIGIIGSRVLSVPERQQTERIFKAIFSCLDSDTVIHHGNQQGVENIAVAIAKKHGITCRGHNVRTGTASHYKNRVAELVRCCDKFIIVRSVVSDSQDTMWAYVQGENAGLDVELINLNKPRGRYGR